MLLVKILYMVRNPIDVIPSGLSLVTGVLDKMFGFWNLSKDKKELFAKHCNGWYRYGYGRAYRNDLLSDFDKQVLDNVKYDVRKTES